MAALASYAVMMARILSTLSPATPPPSGDNSPLGWVRLYRPTHGGQRRLGRLGWLEILDLDPIPAEKGFAQPSGS